MRLIDNINSLLGEVTIARSRLHIETFYNTTDIGSFPERRKPLSFHCPLKHRGDVIGFVTRTTRRPSKKWTSSCPGSIRASTW